MSASPSLTSWKRSSPAAERREALAAVRRDTRLAAALEPRVRSLFRTELRAVLAAEAGGPAAMRAAVRPERWEDLLARVWLGQAPEAVWQPTLAKLGGPDIDWRDYLPERLGPLIQQQAKAIATTTRQRLDTLQLEKRVKDSVRRRAIRRLYNTFGSSRAGRIALGAVVQATATVQHLAADAVARITAAEIAKTWVTVGDDRVRPTHAEASGQTRREDEPFSVGGASLMYPRDPEGPMDEVAGCRCWAVYETVGGAGTERGAIGRPPEPERVNVRAEDFTEGSATAGMREEMRYGIQDFYDQHKDSALLRHLSSADEVADSATRTWQRYLDDGETRIAISPENMRKVLDEGRFKSQFETSTSGGALSRDMRAEIEEQLWGYGMSAADEMRPIYGYVSPRNQRNPLAEAYGKVQVVLKDTVRARTTVTGTDSLQGSALPSPITNLQAESLPWQEMTPLRAINGTGYGPANTYFEAQIHGQVTVADIDRIIFMNREGYPVPDGLFAHLDELGIPYDVQVYR